MMANQSFCARFEKIGEGAFALSPRDGYTLNDVVLPRRSTKGSAGYDFFSNEDFTFHPNESHVFKTGVCCRMDPNIVLMIYPRSGLGFKTGMTLANTVGIIDSDFYHCNEQDGEISIKITAHDTPFTIHKGDKIAQGIFTVFFAAQNDLYNTFEDRSGGFGSTDTKPVSGKENRS